MLEADYRIVPYHPEHRTQVIELQKGLWSPSAELNAAYLDWKHLHNPYLTEPLIYLAMHGERIVGMRGFFGAQWQFGSPPQKVVIPCAGDMLIAPDHRNRGLMTRIMKVALQELAKKGFTYVFSLNAGLTTFLSQMAMGWRSAGSLQPMKRTNSKKKSLVRAFLEASPRVVSVYRRLRGSERRAPGSPSGPPRNHFNVFDTQSDRCGHKIGAHVSIEKTPRPHEMAELVARLGYDGRIRHVQDEPYFAWRFQNPRSNYRFLFWDDARLEGYLVLQATPLP